MSLKTTIEADIKKAMIARNAEDLRALRAIKSMIMLAETEKGATGELSADQESKILAKAHKQRKESADIFAQQGRKDLEEKELEEIEVIERYLPKQLSNEEIEAAVKSIVTSVGAKSAADMGKVMGVASKELAGKADGKAVSEAVKKILSTLA
ncbi:GatB/YqeY domain-containing protein [uncultured Cytophaga sp.]|uniref:GatB/YqeY domain-containing protein n=1 Tax=uncultured Cytophaga sp. TaxID=160238 RepID=UPI002621FB01|nr:GatB/YqeY domain-containing protein [uncultured Cytophaga sp.]